MCLGSFIERKRCALTWHYRRAEDEKLALTQSRECHKELVAGVARKWDVEVMPGKANIEVRPTFINKGEIINRLVKTYHQPGPGQADESIKGGVEFALCMGDDFTDEDMFRSLNGQSGSVLDPDNVFTVTVGASTKLTLAKWHLLEPEDVVECVSLLAGVGEDETVSKQLSEVNLAAVSTVEGQIPKQ